MKEVYTHDEATAIVDLFDELLVERGIKVPSPEDDDREPDNDAALYGSVYDDLLSDVEYHLIQLLENHTQDSKVITDIYSGTM